MAGPTIASLTKAHPSAAHLAIYDGQLRIGTVIDTRRPDRGAPKAPAFAFDLFDRCLGEFADRKAASAAVSMGPLRRVRESEAE